MQANAPFNSELNADRVPLNNFNTQGGNSSANLEIPGGLTLDEIHIEYNHDATGGDEFDPSHFTAIRVNLNGEDIIDVKGTDLATLEGYKVTAQDGFLCIPFAELIAKTIDGMHYTGLPTFKQDAISLEVEIGNAKATSTDATYKAFAVFSPARAVRSVIPKIRRWSYSNNTTGDFEITNLPRGAKYRRMHFLSANVGGLKVYLDRVKRFDLTAARNTYLLKRFERNPQANTFHFDPVMSGYQLAYMMNTAGLSSMEFVLDMTGTGSVPILVEYVEPANGK